MGDVIVHPTPPLTPCARGGGGALCGQGFPMRSRTSMSLTGAAERGQCPGRFGATRPTSNGNGNGVRRAVEPSPRVPVLPFSLGPSSALSNCTADVKWGSMIGEGRHGSS